MRIARRVQRPLANVILMQTGKVLIDDSKKNNQAGLLLDHQVGGEALAVPEPS